jgi:hypothetical protein
MPTQQQLHEWHSAFSKIERVDNYRKLHKHFQLVCKQIEDLKENVEHVKLPKNPREDAIQCHEKITHRMLIRQKTRMEKQLQELAKTIEADIVAYKNEGDV